MATALENLKTRYEAVCTEIAALTSVSDDGGYKRGLYAELSELEQRIIALGGSIDGASAPVEEDSQGVV